MSMTYSKRRNRQAKTKKINNRWANKYTYQIGENKRLGGGSIKGRRNQKSGLGYQRSLQEPRGSSAKKVKRAFGY